MCAARGLTVRESVWGPIVGTDLQGRKLAYRWVAHDAAAVGLGAALELEQAGNAKEALAIAHRLSIPHQNVVAGDAAGNIGWTVTSAVPRRVGDLGQQRFVPTRDDSHAPFARERWSFLQVVGIIPFPAAIACRGPLAHRRSGVRYRWDREFLDGLGRSRGRCGVATSRPRRRSRRY